MKEWLSINQLAEQTLIPDTTVRRYIQKLPDFFHYKGGSRSRRYEETAIKVLSRIKDLYDQGYETDQVDEVLRREFSMIVDGDSVVSDEKSHTPALATVEDVAEIKDLLKQQQEFNKLLLEKLASQEQYIKESLEKRDSQLMESLRTVQEEKKVMLETISTKEQTKPSFFKRLFGRY
jgi:DNA-binding transcriptional MerR regulator